MKQKIIAQHVQGILACACFIMIKATTVFSQTPARGSTEEITKKLANPVSSLISVPLQNNMDVGIGKYNGTRNTLNVQPVIPITLSAKLNMITRVILPFLAQKNMYKESSQESGLGDALLSIFLSPSDSKNGLTWGAGPVILVPTATHDLLGTKKLGFGPSVVVLKQTNGWTFGGLVNQVWSVAGNKDRPDVNQFYLQPFLNHNWKSGAGLGISSEITHNWDTKTNSIWIVPSVTGITKLGKQTVQLSLGPRIQTTAPEGRKADFGVRTSITFVFPN